ncbi:MAG: ABC transporter substrate-binding protein [Lachnospirales bacterium]
MKKLSKIFLGGTLLASVALIGCSSDTASAEKDVATESEAGEEDVTEEKVEEVEASDGNHITGDVLVKNVNARKAIAVGYDESYITEEILADGSISADYYVPVNYAKNPEGNDYRDGVDSYLVYDVEKAKEYWETAKSELGFETAEFTILNYDNESSKKIGEFLKSELEQNLEGLTVNVEMVPSQQKLERSRNGEFDVELAGWSPVYLDGVAFLGKWTSDSAYNSGGYVSDEYDSLVNGVYSSVEERYEGLIEAERILLEEDAAIAPIYQGNKSFLDNREVSVITSHPFGAHFTYEWTELDREDKVLKLLESSKVPTMDNSLATDSVSFNIITSITDGLVSLGEEGGNIIPSLAESWDVSDDGLTYTFHIRKDATFVNYLGEVVGDVTAQSFVDSWERLENPETGASNAYLVRDVANMDTYTAVDDYTLEVVLTKDTPWFLSILTFGPFNPIHKESVDAFGDTYGTTLETTISCGPFYLTDWNFSERVIITKNPHYYDADNIKLDGVNFRIIEGVENETAVNMYFAGELDRVPLTGENVEIYSGHEDLTEVIQARINYLVFNIDDN